MCSYQLRTYVHIFYLHSNQNVLVRMVFDIEDEMKKMKKAQDQILPRLLHLKK